MDPREARRTLGFSAGEQLDWPRLKQRFKQLALRVHPDKGGDVRVFKRVVRALEALHRELKLAQQDRQFNELRADALSAAAPAPTGSSRADFDSKEFNRVFDEVRLPDAARDTGYGDWLGSREQQPPPKLSGGLSADLFNRAFEQYNPQQPPPADQRQIVAGGEPSCTSLSCQLQRYTELGAAPPTDYSGENTTRRTLHYSDLKLAHTTSRICGAQPTPQGSRRPATVEQLESARAAAAAQPPTPEELERRAERAQLAEQQEAHRLAALRERDRQERAWFERHQPLFAARLMQG